MVCFYCYVGSLLASNPGFPFGFCLTALNKIRNGNMFISRSGEPGNEASKLPRLSVPDTFVQSGNETAILMNGQSL